MLSSRSTPWWFQSTGGPQSLHTILKTIASLMASIVTIVQLMMFTFDSFNYVLLHSYMGNTSLNHSRMCKALLFSHIVPCFLQALGLVHIKPRQILDQWCIKPSTRQRLIIWIYHTPWEGPHPFQEFFRNSSPLFFSTFVSFLMMIRSQPSHFLANLA